MKTTVATTAKGVLPYHFVCNYCGARCDRTVDVVGNAYGGRENRAGALADLGNEPERYRKKIRDYRQRLTAGKALPAGKYDPVEYSASSLLSLGLDGVCTRCGRVQAWAIDPSGSGDKARKGCLRILLFDLLGLALFLIGALLTNGTAGAVLMVLGGAVFGRPPRDEEKAGRARRRAERPGKAAGDRRVRPADRKTDSDSGRVHDAAGVGFLPRRTDRPADGREGDPTHLRKNMKAQGTKKKRPERSVPATAGPQGVFSCSHPFYISSAIVSAAIQP